MRIKRAIADSENKENFSYKNLLFVGTIHELCHVFSFNTGLSCDFYAIVFFCECPIRFSRYLSQLFFLYSFGKLKTIFFMSFSSTSIPSIEDI